MSEAVSFGRQHTGDLRLEAEVVVVGSGAGGAVAAAILQEAGHDVLVLEEGGYVHPDEHARMRPSQSLRHLWREAGLTATLALGDSPLINVMMGRCVGGSSMLTGGVCFRIPETVLHEWRQDHHLHDMTPEHLEPYYREVEEAISVQEVPKEMRSRSTQLFGLGAERMGFKLESMRRNTSGCVGWSTCNFGCPSGAKMSVGRTYLPRAQAAGTRIWSDCLVERVKIEGDRAVGVSGRVLNREGGRPGGRLTVKAKQVILAAGSLYTPLILKRSGVGRASAQVGRNLTLHPAFRIMARFEEEVRGGQGALQSAFSSHYEPEGIQFNSVFVPTGVLAATQPGVGDAHAERAAMLPHLAMFGANLHDDGGGTVHRIIGREPVVTYRMADKDRVAMRRALRIAGQTFFAAGAKEVFLPILGAPAMDPDQFAAYDLEHMPARRLECTSQHPLGSVRMAATAGAGVVDPDHQSWEVRGLYVSDGSVVPTSLGVNPQLTIMTLATRFARRFLGH
ncbi:MAG: GMC family oxidoreductase [Myxococcales bacterium]|nr:GMC family oxidoreductase [Myxococcales bacterium]MCB9649042.1 GMC family oxidoreductase [Deltaproteobacteria bacterium]